MGFKKLFDHQWPRNHGLVRTLIFGCVDRRIKGSRGLLGKRMGFDMSIPITIPGGVKDLARPKHPRDREYLLEKIGLLEPDLDVVIATVHNDCLGCERSMDLAFYEDVLSRAGAILRERFPRLGVVLILVDFDGFYILEETEVVAEVGAN